jgi:hypothetical protein
MLATFASVPWKTALSRKVGTFLQDEMEAQPRYSPKGVGERQPVIVFFFTKFDMRVASSVKSMRDYCPSRIACHAKRPGKPCENKIVV